MTDENCAVSVASRIHDRHGVFIVIRNQQLSALPLTGHRNYLVSTTEPYAKKSFFKIKQSDS